MTVEERREERNARIRKWRAEHKEERNARIKKYITEHREEIQARHKKWKAEHRDEVNARIRKSRSEHFEEYRKYLRDRRAEHREEYNAMMRKHNSDNLNKNGVRKSTIRVMSGKILEKCHAKLPGYEIHHCFGYEDPEKFIYIPRSLHLQIHQLLRDNRIPADTDHWTHIRDLVNECEDYTYIRA